jgi:plastocyanin
MPRTASNRPHCLLLLGLLLTGCDEQARPDPSAPRVPAESVTGPGVVQGRVMFKGKPPALPALRNEPCCPGAPTTLLDESFIQNADGSLANCFVYVEGAPRTTGAALPPASLDQKNCQYIPHLVGIVVGQTLRVTSSDDTTHNVHYQPKYSADANLWMKKAGESADITFPAPEVIRTGCDVHPWMSAHIGVFDNPFFAITADGGTFNIPNLPVGKYTLTVWHERYGRLQQELVIRDSTPVKTDFVYQPPSR